MPFVVDNVWPFWAVPDATGATVFVEDVKQEKTTNCELELALGKHVVRVELKGKPGGKECGDDESNA